MKWPWSRRRDETVRTLTQERNHDNARDEIDEMKRREAEDLRRLEVLEAEVEALSRRRRRYGSH
jgi:predicted Zn-dependent peptidase